MSHITVISEKQVIFVDASALKHSGCWRKFVWMIKYNYRPNKWIENPYKPAYGTGGHKFLQHYYAGKPHNYCIKEALDYYQKFEDVGLPEKEIRTVEHLQFTLHQYINHYHKMDLLEPCRAPSGELQIEEKFAIPYWENEHYIVMLCGTRDMRARYAGMDCIVDHKFSYSTRPNQFFDKFELDVQTLFYVWFERWVGAATRYLPIMINAILIHPIRENGTTAQFIRSRPIEYPEGVMIQFENWVLNKLNRLCSLLTIAEKPIDFQPDISFCHSTFGGICQYHNVCQLDPSIQQQSLDSNFDSGTYNPLTFSDE